MNHSSLREELQQMALAARLYYEEDRTQQEVANVLGVSRPTVSRLLERAKEERIVTITVKNPFESDTALADRLCKATGLAQAIITPAVVNATEVNMRRLGISAARYLESTLKPEDVMGVGWGRTLYSVVQSIVSKPISGVTLVPLMGSLGQVSPSFQVNELIRRMAESFDGKWHLFFLPAIVAEKGVKASLLASKDTKKVTGIWKNLTTALVGIGNVDFDTEMTMLFLDYLDATTRRRLMEAGAVGDICMRFFDKDGAPVKDGLHGVLSISLEQLRRVPNVIGVAGGTHKTSAILGAIRGKYIKTLITDDITAHSILSTLGGQKRDSRQADKA